MPKLPKLPGLPDPENIFSAIDKAGDVVGKGVSLIDRVANRIDRLTGKLGPSKPPETATQETTEALGASNETTLKYQLDLIIDDLEHLETEHLPEQGRLNGEPCDCIAKAARSLRRHASETIPIASRQSKDASIFAEIRDWTQHLIDIGTADKVRTGKYDAEYLEQAGSASNYRKQIEGMSTEGCSTCEEARESIKQFIEKRKRERGET